MKRTIAFLLLIASIQSMAQTGTLRGTVYDGKDGQTLIGAAVVLAGTTDGVSTDLDGNYSLSLPAGTHDIQVSFISFSSQTITDVEVKDGEVTVLDISLSSDVQQMAEVVITAKQARNTENALLSMQKKSTNVIDGISSQTFRKIGDSNAAGALKRVPGVSIQGGKHVYVRGLGDRYTKTILNGMAIPGLDPDKNSVQVDIFPTNVIDNIVVYKTFSPDLPGDFTGGIVDIQTKDFPEEKTFSFNYSAGYNPDMTFNEGYIGAEGGKTDLLGFDDGTRELPIRAGAPTPDPSQNDPRLTGLTRRFDGTLAAEKRTNFFDQSIGASAGDQKEGKKFTYGYSGLISYNLDYDFYEDVELGRYRKLPVTGADTGVDFTQLRKEETRNGSVGEQNVLWSGLGTFALKSKRFSSTFNAFRSQGSSSVASKRVSRNFEQTGATLLEDILTYTQRAMSNFSLSNTYRTADWKLDMKAAYTQSSIDDPDFRVTALALGDFEGDTLLARGDGARIDRFYRELDENNISGRLDAERILGERHGSDWKMKAGAAFTRKVRDYRIINLEFDYTNGSDISGDPDWFFESENIWTPETGEGTYLSSNQVEPTNVFNARQTIAAGYLMTELPLTKRLKTITGVRVEKTDMFYTGENNAGTRRLRDEKTLDEMSILPSLNFVYALTENANLRASYNRTLARPTFKEKSVAEIYDPISNLTFIGNLDLGQTDIDNVDLRWEFFPRLGEVVSISFFGKRFDGHIELAPYESNTDNLQPLNSGISYAAGVELEVRKTLDLLSDSLRTWSIGGNISIVESRLDTRTVILPGERKSEYDIRLENARPGERIKEYRPMAGQSPYLINGYLNFSDRKSGFDANLSYNVQGKSLSIVGRGLVPDVYDLPISLLNMRIAKSLGEKGRSQLSLKVTNLLGSERIRQYESYASDGEIFSKYYDSRDITLGYRYTFGR